MEFEKLAELISEKMEIDQDEISMDSTFEDLKVDSLDMVEIVMEIEEAFDISIEEADDLKTVGDLVEFIQAARSK